MSRPRSRCLCAIILASRNYRALCHRDENASLAPHWLALATLLWLSAFGFLGALSTHPDILHALRASSLAWARDWLMGWALLAITLAAVNLLASELRGDNRRVTGYLPLWLIGFGVGLAGIASLCRGVAELYLRDLAGLEAAALREATLPLTLIWMICLLAVALGIMIFALGFLARRPRMPVRKSQTRPADERRAASLGSAQARTDPGHARMPQPLPFSQGRLHIVGHTPQLDAQFAIPPFQQRPFRPAGMPE